MFTTETSQCWSDLAYVIPQNSLFEITSVTEQLNDVQCKARCIMSASCNAWTWKRKSSTTVSCALFANNREIDLSDYAYDPNSISSWNVPCQSDVPTNDDLDRYYVMNNDESVLENLRSPSSTQWPDERLSTTTSTTTRTSTTRGPASTASSTTTRTSTTRGPASTASSTTTSTTTRTSTTRGPASTASSTDIEDTSTLWSPVPESNLISSTTGEASASVVNTLVFFDWRHGVEVAEAYPPIYTLTNVDPESCEWLCLNDGGRCLSFSWRDNHEEADGGGICRIYGSCIPDESLFTLYTRNAESKLNRYGIAMANQKKFFQRVIAFFDETDVVVTGMNKGRCTFPEEMQMRWPSLFMVTLLVLTVVGFAAISLAIMFKVCQ